jgi:molecular chaperone GrpE
VTDPVNGTEGPDQGEAQGPVVRDKRRLDPVTGMVREVREPAGTPAPGLPAPGAPAPGAPAPDSPADGAAEDDGARQLAERTADLQRLQADYSNYRRRVERDREVVRETAVANVLANLLPVLDDIGRAREHGELEGGFRSVAEALEQTVERLGMARFGAPGDPFDPTVHEALTHMHSADVTSPTCVEVFQPGYRLGDRVVRPARVAVADPES